MIRNPEAIEVRDEGATQGRARIFDFAGAGVTAAVSGQTATVTIAGGGAGADPVQGAYAPGSFTLVTEKYAVMSRHLKLTTTQRATLQGTSTLRIT
jgi:hypothetical protein